MSLLFENVAETYTKIILIESITLVGSAFGVTTDGEQVFINKRIVEATGVKTGDTVEALLIANYEDKRVSIPYRALRLSRTTNTVPDPRPVVRAYSGDTVFEPEVEPEPEQPKVNKLDLIVNLLDETGPLRTATIARELKLDFAETSTLCMGLFAEKRVAMAEVYSEPNQKRASLRIWAVDLNDFDVDPSAS